MLKIKPTKSWIKRIKGHSVYVAIYRRSKRKRKNVLIMMWIKATVAAIDIDEDSLTVHIPHEHQHLVETAKKDTMGVGFLSGFGTEWRWH